MQKKLAEDPIPETVVIVAFGEHQDSGKNLQKAIKDQNFHEFDVRQWLQRDPSVSVLHGENGEYQSTQRCVLQQEGFAKPHEATHRCRMDQRQNHRVLLGGHPSQRRRRQDA